MTRARRRVGILAASVLLLSGLAASGPAAAQQDPAFVPWARLLPGLATRYQPSSANLCNQGSIRCVDAVIEEMRGRFDPLAARCDHDAVFALTYLRTTEEYRRATTTPGFFSDPPFMNHHDAVFAKLYFDAYDNWHAGRRSQVPAAWRVAFRAADQRRVSAAGNLLLGMSAHVNRDLPYVLESIGLVKPGGASRKPDHDRVNVFLNRVTEPLIAEVSRRFDPSIKRLGVQGTTLDETVLFQLIQGWRELAWRNAELLAAAETPAARAVVAQLIETTAAAEASAIALATGYLPLLASSKGRDSWCAAHHDDP